MKFLEIYLNELLNVKMKKKIIQDNTLRQHLQLVQRRSKLLKNEIEIKLNRNVRNSTLFGLKNLIHFSLAICTFDTTKSELSHLLESSLTKILKRLPADAEGIFFDR